ncbi:MAG: hypothetical protein IJO64_04960 [Clostridia bacterium]|nr:hypothetical protein [Clostridia bacterium]
MKQLTCEMCGGTDLIKQDGAFVCQNCGMKYSVEEAKKMMVEGTVKVDNSDRVKNYYELARTAKAEDDSSTAAKYYTLILEEVPDSWEAKFYSTYYEAMECKVREAYSMCIKLEKNAHSVLTAIKNSEPKDKQVEYTLEITDKMNEIALMFHNGNSEEATEEVPNLLLIWGDQLEEKFIDVPEITDKAATFWENALTVIIDTYGTGDANIDSKIATYRAKIKKYHKDYEPPKSNLTYHTASSPNKLSVTVIKVGHETYESAPLIGVPVKVFANGPDEVGHIGAKIKLKNIAGKTINYITVYLTPYNSVGDAVCCTVQGHSTYGINITGPIAVGAKWEGTCDGMWYNNTIVSARIDHVDVTYSDDTIERYTASELSDENSASSNTSGGSNGSGGSGGCYVATAVYGSYDCPQVWTLRRYRDYTLAETWYGRAFIKTYYAISPTLVKWFGHTKWFKKMWQGKLDRMVAKLQANGVETTPYEDKNW